MRRDPSVRRSGHRLRVVAVVLAAVCAGSPALAASSARAVAPCHDETIRLAQTHGPRLPDCRAYEQVSPMDKSFSDALGTVGIVESSPSGEAVSFDSLGPFPGVPSATGAIPYLSTRGDGEEEWDTQGLLPPTGPQPIGALLQGFSEDLSQGIVEAENTPALDPEAPAGESDTYLRDSATDAYRSIALARVTYADATPSGSGILFETETDLRPSEAAAGVVNLYDWDEGRLSVAGILPGGTAPAGGSVAGSEQNGQRFYKQNTISADGSRVIFSDAGTGQLYAREDPGSASATTVHVSASEKTNGGGPNGTDPDGEQPAMFTAATRDGSDVFFTSPEELTNEANTGPAPGVGRANIDGSSPQVGFIPTSAKGITVSSEYVYWANSEENSIGRARIDGTEIDPSFITDEDNPQYVAVYGNYLYWTNAGKEKEQEGSIGRAEVSGANVEEDFISGASDPQGIVVNSEYIYWANVPTEKPTKRTIARAKVDGEGVELTGFVTKTETPGGVAVNSEYIYWAIPSTNEIGRAPIAGGKGTPGFITGASDPQGVAVNSEYVYWANSHTGTIARAPITGGVGEAPLVTGLTDPWGVADEDGGDLYWTSGGGDEGNDLYRYDFVPGTGPALTDLTPDPGEPDGANVLGVLGVSEDGSYVYFVANGVLAAGASTGDCTSEHGEVGGGECNLYLWHAGVTTFITRLNGPSDVKPDVQHMQHPNEASGPDAGLRSSRVDPAGSTLLFASHEKLTGYENGRHDELYLYRAASEAGPATLRCVSCNPDGAAATAEAYLGHNGPELPADAGYEFDNVYLPRNLSENGERVFFQTEEALQTEGRESSTNGKMNVYEWEEAGEGSCPAGQSQGCIYLISTGQSTSESFFGDASVNGENVFFFTRQPLVTQDNDENIDLYDARVDGGIAIQSQPPPAPPCEGESGCRAVSPGQSPGFGAPSSSTSSSTGNLTSPPAKQEVKGGKTSKPLTRAQKLSKALEVCQKQHRHSHKKRRACEAHARKLYGPKKGKRGAKAKKSVGRAK